MPRRIPGSAGATRPTEPPVVREPAPEPEKIASLVNESGQWKVHVGNNRVFSLDSASVNLLAGRSGTPPQQRNGGAPAGELQAAIEAARNNRALLSRLPGVISVRAGYKFIGGRITSIPAVVVAVNRKLRDVPPSARVPPIVDGVPTDVTVADPYEKLAALRAGAQEAAPQVLQPPLLIDQIQEVPTVAMEEALPMISYTAPPEGDLNPVTGPMTLTCHVSPDAGWGVLKPFLQGTRQKIRLGMYDFTAPHIYQAVRTLLRDSDVSWEQTLSPGEALPSEDDVDSPKAGDLTEDQIVRGLKRVASGGRFANAFAHLGSGRTFASAYHIKVAVRDDSAFWLSSGNWQSSNQPEQDFLDPEADRKLIPKFNREWHVVVENATLAKRFQTFLEHDFETASEPEEAALLEAAAVALPDLLVDSEELLEEERATADLEVFPPQRFVFTAAKPLTIQPILTPDNYVQIVLELLRSKPRTRLYFQNQSLSPVKSPSPEFAEMMELLAKYSKAEKLDTRFIFRNIGPVRKKLESLQLAGFDMRRVRMQAGCHTKGIIIDSATVLLGSHNFTNQGVQVNRDASLLIRDQPAIAQYYERVFLHDWEKLTRETIREESTPVALTPGPEAAQWHPVGFAVRVPWHYYAEE